MADNDATVEQPEDEAEIDPLETEPDEDELAEGDVIADPDALLADDDEFVADADEENTDDADEQEKKKKKNDDDDDGEEEDAAAADDTASTRRRKAEDEDEEEDDDMLAPDDVEADLDRILKDRMVTSDEQDEAEDEVDDATPGERGEEAGRLQPKRSDEQLCGKCFLLVRASAPVCPVGDDDCPIFS